MAMGGHGPWAWPWAWRVHRPIGTQFSFFAHNLLWNVDMSHDNQWRMVRHVMTWEAEQRWANYIMIIAMYRIIAQINRTNGSALISYLLSVERVHALYTCICLYIKLMNKYHFSIIMQKLTTIFCSFLNTVYAGVTCNIRATLKRGPQLCGPHCGPYFRH